MPLTQAIPFDDSVPAPVGQIGQATQGTETTVPRGDHVHDVTNAFSATVPGASAPGDAAATGSSGSVPRRDHVHGRESYATIASNLKLDDLAAPDDNTDLNVSTTKHGLMSKLPGGGTNFLREDGTWAAPSGSGAPASVDYLVGTADAGLSAEIVVGATPGGELGGTWAAPTVDAVHSGSSHVRELDYVEKTTATSVTATTEATADTVVTSSAITYDGATAILIEFYCNYFEAPASVNVRLFLYDGTSIGALAVVTPPASLFRQPVHVARRLTPTAAEHTYSIRAQTDSGTASVNAGAGGSGNAMPAFIRITRAL